MKSEITTITPEQATKLLKGNTANRSIRPKLVEQYARDMATGAWKMNGEAIVMNGRTLIDGQHRLLACQMSGEAFRTVFVTGVKLDAITTIDQGARRTLGDALKLLGEADPSALASSVSAGWRWDNGTLNNNKKNPSNAEALAWLWTNPEIRAAIKLAVPLRYNPLRSRTSVTSLLAMRAIQNGMEFEVREFLYGLVSGADLSNDNPVFRLRNALINNATATKKIKLVPMFARTIKAWNAYILGEPMGFLSWRPSYSKRGEEFPVMVNRYGQAISYYDAPEAEMAS
jgi:hypothetical protein